MRWFWLKVARPGLWFQTLWLYLLPTAGQPELLRSPAFWLGLAFVCYPLNLLVYGWNDVVDFDIDQLNPRKDSFLFGARGSRAELAHVPRLIVAVNAPFAIGLTIVGGGWLLLLFAAIVVTNAAYNWPRHGLRSQPPFELLNQLGYLLILPLSSLLNGLAHVRPAAVVYLVLFCTHAHLMGEVMDIVPDRQGGRRTTATVLGARATKLVVIALVLAEALFLIVAFDELVLGVFLALGAAWLALDLFVVYGEREYSRREFRLFGLALNAAGFASIAWVWWQGSLS